MTGNTILIDRPAVSVAGLVLMLFLTTGVYWPGLAGPLILDDMVNLEPLFAMQHGEYSWREAVMAGRAGPTGRPVALLSFVANFLSSGDSIWHLKLTNLLIHLLCGVLVYVLSLQLCAAVDATRSKRHWLALWVCATWLCAPLFVSTVLYVVQRMAQLATLFVLCGLSAYAAGRTRLDDSRRDAVLLFAVTWLVCWPLAALSKENGFVLPVLALLLECYFWRFSASTANRRVLIAMFTGLLAPGLVWLLVKTALQPTWLTSGYSNRPFDLVERLLTQARVLVDYVTNLLMIPGGTPMGVFHDDYQLSTSLLQPWTTLPAIVAWLVVLLASYRWRHARWSVLFFGPLFFLVAHGIESSVIPLALYFEHRNYLPAFGILFTLAVGGSLVLEKLHATRLIAAALFAVPLGFSVATAQRAIIWDSWSGIVRSSAYSHPGSFSVNTNLASLYMNRGEYAKADRQLKIADGLAGGRHQTGIRLHQLIAYCHRSAPVPEQAYLRLEQSKNSQLGIYLTNLLGWFAGAVATGNCAPVDAARVAAALGDAVAANREARRPAPYWQIQVFIADLFASAAHYEQAMKHLRAALVLRPERLEPGIKLVELQRLRQDYPGARETLRGLMENDLGNVRSHTLRLNALANTAPK